MLAHHAATAPATTMTRASSFLEKGEQAETRGELRYLLDGRKGTQDRALACCSLTEREIQTMNLVALGYSNKQVADSLSITENTVKTYLKTIFKKLKVENRTAATLKALRCGLVPMPARLEPHAGG